MMKPKIKVGDTVSLKSAILFGLETFLLDHFENHPDPDLRVKKIVWGHESFSQADAANSVISFLEPPKPADIPPNPKDATIRVVTWPVFIQGMLPDSFANPTYPAYELCAELKMVLHSMIEGSVTQSSMGAVNNILNLGPEAQRKRGFNANLHQLQVGAETVRGPGDHSRFAFFWLPIYFTITEDLKNPRVTAQDPL